MITYRVNTRVNGFDLEEKIYTGNFPENSVIESFPDNGIIGKLRSTVLDEGFDSIILMTVADNKETIIHIQKDTN